MVMLVSSSFGVKFGIHLCISQLPDETGAAMFASGVSRLVLPVTGWLNPSAIPLDEPRNSPALPWVCALTVPYAFWGVGIGSSGCWITPLLQGFSRWALWDGCSRLGMW
jgi:hypothetical protein